MKDIYQVVFSEVAIFKKIVILGPIFHGFCFIRYKTVDKFFNNFAEH